MLEIKNLKLNLSSNTLINDFSFVFEKSKSYVILGPSGIGKSTLLNCIANIKKDYLGTINNSFENISYSFQENCLIPWLSAIDNLKYINDNNTDIDLFMDLFSITHLKNQKTNSLSGGEKKRLTLCRAFLNNPDLILIDESFSSLNLSLKFEIIKKMNNYLNNKNKTVIYVSHNIQESLLIGDEILIINEEGILVESFKNEIDKLNFLPLSEKFFNHEKELLSFLLKAY
ncbi:MAG: ATP-binding cassette domain-containing protein [Fusobacteriaceae bacterium]|nr:ATP-binding cassette domain-containing protein [Fusobacteriaceae bacterium]